MRLGSRLFFDRRGVSSAEYALLLVGVLLVSAGGYKLLGDTMRSKLQGAGDGVSSSAGGGGASGGSGNGAGQGAGGAKNAGGAGAGGAGAGGAAGARGPEDKITATEKVAVGGAGNAGAGKAAGAGGTAAGAAAGSNGTVEGSTINTASTVDDFGDLKLKRTLATSFIIAGAIALLYFGYKARQATKEGPS